MVNFIKKRFKLLIILSVVILAVFIVYPKISKGQNGKKQESAKVARGNLEEKLTISGSIDAEEKVTLRFQTSGRLAWVGVKEGDYVKKYQGIASLDQRELEKTLKKKLLVYMNERWDFEQGQDDKSVRGRYLYQVPGLTDAERRVLEKSQFDLDSTVLDVEIAALVKEYAFLWTPIEGIVTKIMASYAGVNITPATSEFDVVNPKTVFFTATADQTEVVKLKEGMVGDLVLDAYPDATISGVIKNISFGPKSGETGIVYSIKFIFNEDNLDYHYRLGMAGDLSFSTKRKDDVLYLPSKFVKEEKSVDSGKAGKKYVQIKIKGKLEKVYVETGMETDEDIEIANGINEGEVVYN